MIMENTATASQLIEKVFKKSHHRPKTQNDLLLLIACYTITHAGREPDELWEQYKKEKEIEKPNSIINPLI